MNIHPLDIWWWKYIFEKDGKHWPSLKRIFCRINNHKAGPVWYSHKLEPDMRCRNCGDDLG